MFSSKEVRDVTVCMEVCAWGGATDNWLEPRHGQDSHRLIVDRFQYAESKLTCLAEGMGEVRQAKTDDLTK